MGAEISGGGVMMTPHEKREFLRLIEKIPTTTPCADCVHWKAGFCTKWEDTIPAEALPAGCDEWKFNRFSPPF